MEYVLVTDNDAHWYVIPADKQTEWWKYVELCDQFLENDLSEPEGIEPEEPDWCEHVGGAPSMVLFKEYTVK